MASSNSNITSIRRNIQKGLTAQDCMDAETLIAKVEEIKGKLEDGRIDAKDAKVIIDACLKQLSYLMPTLKSVESKSDSDKKSYAEALADINKKKS